MKKVYGIVLVTLFLAATQVGFAAEKKTQKYEVVDVACYVKDGSKATGAGHKDCAIKCIKGGGELALLRSGDLYIPVDANFHSLRDKFKDKAGQTVEVSGKKASKGGLNYLKIDE